MIFYILVESSKCRYVASYTIEAYSIMSKVVFKSNIVALLSHRYFIICKIALNLLQRLIIKLVVSPYTHIIKALLKGDQTHFF